VTVYIDTSAAVKLLSGAPEADAIAATLDEAAAVGDDLAASLLLETELRRFAVHSGLEQSTVSDFLARVTLLEPDASHYRMAGLMGEADLRCLDALHLAAAVLLGADSIVTFDERQAEAALALGLTVLAPA